MAHNRLVRKIQSSQQRKSSDPTSAGKLPSSGRTPSSVKRRGKSARASPYHTPKDARVALGHGRTRSMELLTPNDLKKFLSNEANRRKEESSPTSPTGLPGRKPNYIKFPPNLGIEEPPSTLVSPPMQGTLREGKVERPLDPGRPTIRLLKVIYKCWDADMEKDSSWTVTNGLLNGRNDERDRNGMWNDLGYAVENVWPGLGSWIMHNRLYDSDAAWFSPADYSVSDEEVCDRNLNNKVSSEDKLGFHMTARAYDAACNVIQWLAEHNGNLEQLESHGINPFFLIYAFADCNIPLPDSFNRQLLWKHLDGILRAKCWRGLTRTRAGQDDCLMRFKYRRRENTNPTPPTFFPKGEDPGDVLRDLLRHSFAGNSIDPTDAPTAFDELVHTHRVQITVDDYKWVAKAQAGSVWYQAGDLRDDDDIACFAVIDCLTRLLPSCQGHTLEITSDHLPLLWGIGGAPVRAWSVVQAICNKYQVKLRLKWNARPGPSPNARVEPAVRDAVIPRDPDVVDAVLKEFEQNGLGGGSPYQCMMAHLSKAT